jgi:hypothetical protein
MTTEEQIEALGGCSSHACLIAPPKGMGTNAAKCYCDEGKIKRALRLRNTECALLRALDAEIGNVRSLLRTAGEVVKDEHAAKRAEAARERRRVRSLIAQRLLDGRRELGRPISVRRREMIDCALTELRELGRRVGR